MDILAFKKFYRLCQNNQLDLATWKKKQFSNVVPVLIDMHSKGPSINYVVSVGGGGGGRDCGPKDDLLHRPYFKKRQQGGERGSEIFDFETT